MNSANHQWLSEFVAQRSTSMYDNPRNNQEEKKESYY